MSIPPYVPNAEEKQVVVRAAARNSKMALAGTLGLSFRPISHLRSLILFGVAPPAAAFASAPRPPALEMERECKEAELLSLDDFAPPVSYAFYPHGLRLGTF